MYMMVSIITKQHLDTKEIFFNLYPPYMWKKLIRKQK